MAPVFSKTTGRHANNAYLTVTPSTSSSALRWRANQLIPTFRDYPDLNTVQCPGALIPRQTGTAGHPSTQGQLPFAGAWEEGMIVARPSPVLKPER